MCRVTAPLTSACRLWITFVNVLRYEPRVKSSHSGSEAREGNSSLEIKNEKVPDLWLNEAVLPWLTAAGKDLQDAVQAGVPRGAARQPANEVTGTLHQHGGWDGLHPAGVWWWHRWCVGPYFSLISLFIITSLLQSNTASALCVLQVWSRCGFCCWSSSQQLCPTVLASTNLRLWSCSSLCSERSPMYQVTHTHTLT